MGIETDLTLVSKPICCISGCALCCHLEPELDEDEVKRLIASGMKSNCVKKTGRKAEKQNLFVLESKEGTSECVILNGRRCFFYPQRPFTCRHFPLNIHLLYRIQPYFSLACPGVWNPIADKNVEYNQDNSSTARLNMEEMRADGKEAWEEYLREKRGEIEEAIKRIDAEIPDVAAECSAIFRSCYEAWKNILTLLDSIEDACAINAIAQDIDFEWENEEDIDKRIRDYAEKVKTSKEKLSFSPDELVQESLKLLEWKKIRDAPLSISSDLSWITLRAYRKNLELICLDGGRPETINVSAIDSFRVLKFSDPALCIVKEYLLEVIRRDHFLGYAHYETAKLGDELDIKAVGAGILASLFTDIITASSAAQMLKEPSSSSISAEWTLWAVRLFELDFPALPTSGVLL